MERLTRADLRRLLDDAARLASLDDFAWVAQQRSGLAADGEPPRAPEPLTVSEVGGRLHLHYLPRPAPDAPDAILLTEVAAEPPAYAPQPLPLTEREHEVVRLIALGESNRGIAVSLDISERTVQQHVQHLLHKLGVGSRTQAAAWAFTHLLDEL